MSLTAFYGAIILGLIYGLMVLGVFISFRILDFPDLTVDGSITMGAALAASLIIAGINPILATLIAPLGGIAAGIITGGLHTKFSIPPLLAGILSMIGLYSINLRIMGRPNLSLLRQPNVFENLQGFGLSRYASGLILSGSIALVFILLFHYFLGTEMGQAMRATGDNENMPRSLGVNTHRMKILGLGLANGAVALGGALLAQYQGFADISMGIGMIIAGLASVIVGEVLLGAKSVPLRLVAVVFGSIVYRLVIALVLRIDFFEPTDLKLFTALIVTIALISPHLKQHMLRVREKARPEIPSARAKMAKQERGKLLAGSTERDQSI